MLGGRPNGGYVMGICLQALSRVMPLPDPLVVSAFFLRPVLPGPAEVRTAAIRSGRRIATGEATLYQAPLLAVPIFYGLGAPVIIADTLFKVFRGAVSLFRVSRQISLITCAA